MFLLNYNELARQQITKITTLEIDRIVSGSEQSLSSVIKRFKSYLKDKDIEHMQWITETINSQKKCAILTISEDFINRPWQETMLDLQKDSIELLKIIGIRDNYIWSQFINKNLLTEIFNKVQETLDRKETFKRMLELQETFSFNFIIN